MQRLMRIALMGVVVFAIVGFIQFLPFAQSGGTAVTQEASTTVGDRLQRGLRLVRRVNQDDFERGQQNFAGIAPDLVRYSVEYAYGDLLSRPGLDLKSRQIATVAALTALGNVQPQLKFHINGALNVGCTRQEIVEIITQLSAYVG